MTFKFCGDGPASGSLRESSSYETSPKTRCLASFVLRIKLQTDLA